MKDSYLEKCHKPIPIGNQIFAYMCEDVSIQPIQGAVVITGWTPSVRGKEPYPNQEKETIYDYDLRIRQFTRNAIEITFTKTFKDQSSEMFLTTLRCFVQ